MQVPLKPLTEFGLTLIIGLVIYYIFYLLNLTSLITCNEFIHISLKPRKNLIVIFLRVNSLGPTVGLRIIVVI